MKPDSIPKLSSRSLAIGPTEFVVQDALETMWCLSLSYLSSLTPMTSVMSGSVAGAEISTFFAPASRCCCCSLARSEEPGGLDDDVDAELVPGQRLRIALAEHAERRAVDADRVAVDLDSREAAVRRVVVEQVREDVRRREVVDRDDVELAPALEVRANEVAPDPAEAVDPDLQCHPQASLVIETQSAARF